MQVVVPIKAKSRLRFRLNTTKFATNPEKSATSTLGLVDGNSTITVNTMGETTDDSSTENKKGIDLATANTVSAFNNYSPSWREVSVLFNCSMNSRSYYFIMRFRLTFLPNLEFLKKCYYLLLVFV